MEKFILFCGIYMTLFTIEHYAPYFSNRQNHIKHSGHNLALAVLNYLVSAALFFTILSQVFIWINENNVGLLYQFNLNTTWNYILAFILLDFWQYVWHRLNHVIPFLWWFHQVHHADKELDASSGVRFHTFEIVFSQITRIAIAPILGIQLEQLLLYELVLLPIILFHHSNIRLNETADLNLRLLIVTPHMHRLHHSDIKEETDSNYASVFSIWDRIFNSYTMRSIEENFRLGLGKKFTEDQWGKFSGMLKIPFAKTTR